MKTLLSVCSARPNFVKLAAIHHAIIQRDDPSVRHVIVHTGQHYDPLLSDIFFTQLSIPQLDINLGVKGGDRESTLGQTYEAIVPVLRDIRPDWVLVYGDVNGALGAARAAEHLGSQIAHVEAGLRSFDHSMPEELNRIEIDQLADLLFVSEQSGMDNLKNEQVKGRPELVGNTMIDTLIRMMPLIERKHVNVFDGDRHSSDPFVIATIHRPSNTDDPQALRQLFDFIIEVSEHISLVIPKHPRLANALRQYLPDIEGRRRHIIFGDPIGYINFLALMKRSAFILTDSGGIQEEAVLLGKRCFTLRRNTERPITIDCGSNILIDPAVDSDTRQVLDFAAHQTMPDIRIPALWDGKAGERILSYIIPV